MAVSRPGILRLSTIRTCPGGGVISSINAVVENQPIEPFAWVDFRIAFASKKLLWEVLAGRLELSLGTEAAERALKIPEEIETC